MVEIVGGAGSQVLVGTAGDDLIYDHVGGDDVLRGGEGNDRLRVGRWNGQGGDRVQLHGEAGDDIVDIGRLNDGALRALLTGGDGNDELSAYRLNRVRLDGGAGADVLLLRETERAFADGGAGVDWIFIDDAAGRVVVSMGDGNDIVYIAASAAPGRIILTLGEGYDTIRLAPDGDDGQAYDETIIVRDFDVSGFDQLNVSDYLRAAGIDPSSAFASGYLKFVQKGDDALLLFDRDAGGDAHGWRTLVRFEDCDASRLSGYHMGGDPGGPLGLPPLGPDSAAVLV